MRKPGCAALLLICCPMVGALESATLSLASIDTADVALRGVTLRMTSLASAAPQWSLHADTMHLPAPLQNLQWLDVSCRAFVWSAEQVLCRQGLAKFKATTGKSQTIAFSLSVERDRVQLKIQRTPLLNGKAHGAADLTASWRGKQLDKLTVSGRFEGLTLQNATGKLAAEGAGLAFKADAQPRGKDWHGAATVQLAAGAVYAEPIYLAAVAGPEPIGLSAQGFWQADTGKIVLQQAEYTHPQAGTVSGRLVIRRLPQWRIETAQLSADIQALQQAAPVYLAPYLQATALEGLSLRGAMQARLALVDNRLQQAELDFNQVDADDGERRFALQGGNGRYRWLRDDAGAQLSSVAWQGLKIKAIPIGSGRLDFATHNRQVVLREPVTLPVLGGTVQIKSFSWQGKADGEPDVHFQGAVDQVSLAKLSQALDWTPLSGTLSGTIPGISYKNKKLELDGELNMHVFGGDVVIRQLALSGLFTDFAQFYSDIDVYNLDLQQITRRFKLGNIEGRLSGFAKNVYLENWRPVTFYAWVGTPDDDPTPHVMSQKAVENIASIGGNAAANAISKGFLSAFQTFGYEALGFGCYLHRGVCQLTGIEAVDQGYYIIKGGGLPRIDVIGYNPRLNWPVLMERLSRIASSDEVIVE